MNFCKGYNAPKSQIQNSHETHFVCDNKTSLFVPLMELWNILHNLLIKNLGNPR